MTCKYYLKGKEFNSEFALDEYLLYAEKYYKELGDDVFQLSAPQMHRRQTLLGLDQAKKKLYEQGLLKNETVVTEYSESRIKVERPHIGVSEFLKQYMKKDGTPLFERFEGDDFFEEKRKMWKDPDYWKNKATLQEIKEVFGPSANEGRVIIDQAEFDLIRARFEEQWKQQSYLGTATHAAMAAYWQALHRKKDVNNLEVVKSYMKEQLDKPTSKTNQTHLTEYFSDQHIEQAAKLAQDIHRELDEKFSVVDPHTKKLVPPTYLSEIVITTDVEFEGESTQMVGIADLVVIDALGNIHVIDYKTSPKTYGNYNAYKKKTFYYQLATYRRMIERVMHLNEQSRTFVIPIQFKDFTYDEQNGMQFSELVKGSSGKSHLEEINILIGDETEGIVQNLNTFLPIDPIVDDTPEEILESNEQFMKDCFTSYSDQMELTLEKVKEKIKKQHKGKIKKDNKIDKFKYQLGNETITADSEVELIEEVFNQLQKIKELKTSNTQGLKGLLRNQDLSRLGSMKRVRNNSKENQLENLLARYTMFGWEVKEGPEILNSLGIIILKNRFTNQIDVIKVSNVTWQNLDDTVKLGGVSQFDPSNKNSTITGNFEPDVVQKQKPKSQVLNSNYGNIELMQTTDIINHLPRLFGKHAQLGSILVVDLKKDSAMEASREQLLYNYNTLCKLRSKKNNEASYTKNNYENKNIQVLSRVQLLDRQFKEIMSGEKDLPQFGRKRWDDLNECTTNFDNYTGNKIQLRRDIADFVKKLEEVFKISPEQMDEYDRSKPEFKLYYNASMALAELDGIDFKQQTQNHQYWWQKGVIGWAGSMLDNPGNLQSDTLNVMAEQLNIAYQNIRDDVTKINSKLRELLNKLKQDQGYTWLYTRTIGNQTDLYKNMYDDTDETKFRFKNPFDPSARLTDSEREFLQFALLVFNDNRYGTKSMDELKDAMAKNGPEKYLQVPLTKGTTASRISTEGLMQMAQSKIKALAPDNILETIKQNVEGFITSVNNEEEAKYVKAQNGQQWEMTNYFDAGEHENVRLAWFSDKTKGISFFEHNLETLVLKHAFAYSMKRNMDNVFPIIKAARLHLTMQGTIINEKFVDDIKYLTDFIKAKIFNLSLQEGKAEKVATYVVGELMQVTSKLALAFNPRQLYQVLDGIWKDISLVIRNKGLDNAFTKKNMMDSFFWIMDDLRHFGDNKSMGELINEQYGINDMDMNSYVEKINSDNVGLFNFWSVGFRFASRPDYYNRMTIFGAQMRGDGCFEAHYIKDGRLMYDWTKDKRFSIFAQHWNNPAMQNDPEFKKQKALYIATARQFEIEHAKNDDGTDFVLDLKNPKPLPKAYTIQQSESMKALSDLIYGYYSHEKKSLIQSTTLGAMVFQMNTFWSSKKNQYLAPGGVKMQGRMVHYVENGVPMYHKLDENGEPTDEMTDENTGVPFMQWAGQWQEGILVTLWGMATEMWNGEGSLGNRWSNMWDKYWNAEDENLRKAYRYNLRQFGVDMFGFLALGKLVAPSLLEATKDYTKSVGNDAFETAFVNNCLVNTAAMFESSTKDFWFLDSIFGKGLNWTPVSINSISRLVQNMANMVSGDTDLYDGLTKIFTATRQQEPMLDFIKMQLLGRSVGDNGREE